MIGFTVLAASGDFLLFYGFLINCSQLPVKLMVNFATPEDIQKYQKYWFWIWFLTLNVSKYFSIISYLETDSKIIYSK